MYKINHMSTNIKRSKHLKRYLSLVSIFIILFVTNGLDAVAQQSTKNPRSAEIHMIARADADSVVLRWAPSKSGGWVIANQIGYTIERAKLNPEKPIQRSDYKKMNENSIKPLSLEEWKQKTDENNIFSAVAAQALYGKLFNPQPLSTQNMNVLKNAADELSNRYSFSLFAADNDAFTADALGLRYVDRDVEKDAKYAYRVYLAEKSDQYSFDTTYLVVDMGSYKKPVKPAGLSFKSGDGSIKLTWDNIAEQSYSGYYIYRSDDDGKTYHKMNDMPIVIMTPTNANTLAQPSFTDTLTINYKTYYYQLRGVTSFAELSDPAQIKAFSKDLDAPKAPMIHKPKQINAQEIELSWEMDVISDDLQGFIVSRSKNSVKNYRLLTIDPLSKTTYSFIDDMGGEYESYYTVAAVDTAGNMAFSLPVLASRIDSVPPDVPTGLTGAISKSGVVTLKWDKAKEKNIKGYRVLQANDPKHEFVQLTGQIYSDTIFVDSISLQTLTKKVYYRVAAVNNRYQHSKMSEILELERPDIVPPEQAVFHDVFVTDTNVLLKWYPSTSNDVKMQVLYRMLKDENTWQVLDTFDIQINSFVDNHVEIKMNYEYTIVTIDKSGLKSEPAFPVMARPYDTGKRKPVENLLAEYNDENNTVNLSWNYTPNPKERSWYVIYKSKNGGDFKEYKSLKSSEFEFTDGNVNQGKTDYGIVVMTSHGGESEMEIVSVNVE
jgi:fibronectin type 3 domain-containing protein